MAEGNPLDQLINIDPSLITGDKEVTTKSIRDLPDWLKGYATDYLKRASSLSRSQYPFPDQTVAPFDPFQQAGQNIGARRALGDTTFLGQLNPLALNTLGGSYLSPQSNPWLQQTFNQAAQDVSDQYKYATAPSTQAEFNRAGAFGGSAENQTRGLQQYGLGQTLNNLATDIYGGNYNAERQRQMQQQSMMPQIMDLQYQGPNYLQQLGANKQGLNQTLQDTKYQNQYNRNNWPYQALGILGNAVGGLSGSASNTTTTGPNPNYQSPFQSLLGLSLLNSYGNQAMSSGGGGGGGGGKGGGGGGMLGGLF